jgi:hypothetical protein
MAMKSRQAFTPLFLMLDFWKMFFISREISFLPKHRTTPLDLAYSHIGFADFDFEKVFRFDPIFQKHQNQNKELNHKEEIHTKTQELNFIFLNHQSHK